MPVGIEWQIGALILALFTVYKAARLFRSFRDTGEIKNLLYAQLFAFPAAFLFISVLQARELVADRVLDFLYIGSAAAIFGVGFVLRSRAVAEQKNRKTAKTRKVTKLPAGRKDTGRKAAASTKGRTPSAKKKAKKGKRKDK
jgi:hypothetical protein